MARTPLDLNKTAADWRKWYHTTYPAAAAPTPAAAAPTPAAAAPAAPEEASAAEFKGTYSRIHPKPVNPFINPTITKGEDGQERVTFTKTDLAKLFTYINPTQGMRNPEGAQPQAVQPLPENVIAQLRKGSGG